MSTSNTKRFCNSTGGVWCFSLNWCWFYSHIYLFTADLLFETKVPTTRIEAFITFIIICYYFALLNSEREEILSAFSFFFFKINRKEKFVHAGYWKLSSSWIRNLRWQIFSEFRRCISVDMFHLGSVRFSVAWGKLFLPLSLSLVPEFSLKKCIFSYQYTSAVLPNLTNP